QQPPAFLGGRVDGCTRPEQTQRPEAGCSSPARMRAPAGSCPRLRGRPAGGTDVELLVQLREERSAVRQNMGNTFQRQKGTRHAASGNARDGAREKRPSCRRRHHRRMGRIPRSREGAGDSKSPQRAGQDQAPGRAAAAASSKRSTWRRLLKASIQPPVTPSVQSPPITAAGTAPNQAALVPARNSPSSLEEPMNSMFTAFTRPRMASGVLNWISEERMYMLTMSPPPATSSARNDSQNQPDRANTRLATPNSATARNMVMPTCRLKGRVLR